MEPTEIEKANTLLAGVDSVRYQVAIFNFGLQPNNPTYNEVKTQLLYLDQLNRSNSTSHPVMSTVTSSINKLSVDTPILPTTPTPAQNYNPTFLTLQLGQCAMCGQMKSTHSEGCPQFGKVICTVCERPNHAALFCQRIKKDIKKVSDNTFPSKGNRNNKRDRDHKGTKSNKRRKYKSDDSDSSEEKKDSKDKKKMEKSKIKITKQDPQSDNDDFDTHHVFMLRGNDDEVLLDDHDDSMMDPYWSQASTPAPNYDWNCAHH